MYDDIDLTHEQQELLDAWERQFPSGSERLPPGRRAPLLEAVDPDEGWDRPASPLSAAVNLTRGELAGQRYELARQRLEQVTHFGGDHLSALTELNAASDEVLELSRSDEANEVIDLARRDSRTVHFPTVSSAWHSIA